MIKTSILYDPQHPGDRRFICKDIGKIGRENNVKINVKIVESKKDLLSRLNDRYDFVILHLSDINSMYKIVDKYRSSINGVFVAESTTYPYGKKEVLEHFDEYCGDVCKKDRLPKLFKKYGFMP